MRWPSCIGSLVLVLLSVPAFSQDTSGFSFPEPAKLPAKMLTLWATQYYIHQLVSEGTIPFMDEHGNALGWYGDTCHFCEAALEGTAFVTDSGKVLVLNFVKRGDSTYVDCRKCAKYAQSTLNVESWGAATWAVSSGFGDGVKNYRLVPYRTIAVDPQFIPYGSVIYIPKARGTLMTLPDGQMVEHDGYFFAGDTGGAIKQQHIDVFTGVFTGNPFPGFVRSNANKTFDAYLITDPVIVTALKQVHTK